ncbi:MAG: monophosphatase [Thermotoga sp.]|nr:monophosphatase [Thermotoga sp.]MDK2950240.1 monophosphatase [Thermotoga sp.]
MGERFPHEEEVAGSSPAAPTRRLPLREPLVFLEGGIELDRLDFSIKLLRRVGHFLMLHWGKVDSVEKKTGFKDIVTEIDKKAQEMIVEEIRKVFPDENIIAEEGISENGKKLWIIDPIDGTINFVHGLPNFSISIAYVENGEVKMGVVHAPALNETLYAEERGGAFLNGERIRASRNASLEECVGSTGSYVDFTGKFIEKMEKKTRRVRILGSAALNACYVGAGRVDFFVTWRINPWDIAAGLIVVKEAGGTVTDFAGKEANVFSKNFVFSNGLVHEEVLEVVNEVLKEIGEGK